MTPLRRWNVQVRLFGLTFQLVASAGKLRDKPSVLVNAANQYMDANIALAGPTCVVVMVFRFNQLGGAHALIDGKPAAYDSPIKVPGDAYEPRCAEHFILPGRPH